MRGGAAAGNSTCSVPSKDCIGQRRSRRRCRGDRRLPSRLREDKTEACGGVCMSVGRWVSGWWWYMRMFEDGWVGGGGKCCLTSSMRLSTQFSSSVSPSCTCLNTAVATCFRHRAGSGQAEGPSEQGANTRRDGTQAARLGSATNSRQEGQGCGRGAQVAGQAASAPPALSWARLLGVADAAQKVERPPESSATGRRTCERTARPGRATGRAPGSAAAGWRASGSPPAGTLPPSAPCPRLRARGRLVEGVGG